MRAVDAHLRPARGRPESRRIGSSSRRARVAGPPLAVDRQAHDNPNCSSELTQRLALAAIAPEAVKVLRGFGGYLRSRDIDARLRNLLDIRVSQLNGCAFCLDMHCHEAREAGETQQRLDCLAAWRETDLFSAREKAALAWAEAVTLLSETHVPDDVYAGVREHFSEEELVDLTMVVVAINSWNRVSVSFRREPPDR